MQPWEQLGRRLFWQVCKVFISIQLNFENTFISGDSAGGNLVASLALKTIIHNIRIPDSTVMSYSVLLMKFYPSPSRLLSLIDPVLMQPIIVRCINAYKDQNYSKTLPRTLEEEVALAVDDDNSFLSPLLANKDLLKHFPRTLIIETDMDPCLDDNVEFATKLIDAGVSVHLEVLEGLPHGFLSFSAMSVDCKKGFDHVKQVIEQWI